MKQAVSYYVLPNELLEQKLGNSAFTVAAYLYSVYSVRQANSLLGGQAKIRQTVIATRCHLSVETVRRSLKTLEEKGIIIQKERTGVAPLKLGTTTYTLKLYNLAKGYFRVSRKALPLLNVAEFNVYCHCCRLADNNRNFFQSYSDLARIAGKKRSDVMRLIGRLCELKLLLKARLRTEAGDYTDNHYHVVAFGVLHITPNSSAHMFLRKIAKLLSLPEQLFRRIFKLGRGIPFLERGGG